MGGSPVFEPTDSCGKSSKDVVGGMVLLLSTTYAVAARQQRTMSTMMNPACPSLLMRPKEHQRMNFVSFGVPKSDDARDASS